MNFKYIPTYICRLLKFRKKFRYLINYKSPKKPKVALCLFGIVGNVKGKAGDPIASSGEVLKIGYKHYKEHIFDKNEHVDVFIHTWSTGLKREIKELYKPKKSIIQKQIYFKTPDYIGGDERRKFNQYSASYSSKKAIELKAEYEKENNFKYDIVMLSRFDLAFEEDVIFNKFDPNYFYSANWFTRMNLFGFIPIYTPISYPYLEYSGLTDIWFFSSSENMDKFSKLFDHLDDYNRPNECERNERGITNHNLTRYHLQKIGLSNNIRFVFNHVGWRQSRPSFLFRWYSPKESTPLIRRKYFGSLK